MAGRKRQANSNCPRRRENFSFFCVSQGSYQKLECWDPWLFLEMMITAFLWCCSGRSIFPGLTASMNKELWLLRRGSVTQGRGILPFLLISGTFLVLLQPWTYQIKSKQSSITPLRAEKSIPLDALFFFLKKQRKIKTFSQDSAGDYPLLKIKP